jgi:hypothetical protein
MTSPKTIDITYKDFDYASFMVYQAAISKNGPMALTGVKYLTRHWGQLTDETQLYIIWDLHIRFNLVVPSMKSRLEMVGDEGMQFAWKTLYDAQSESPWHPHGQIHLEKTNEN